ncbi:platelet-derived growth factor C isoform X5 [Sagmatias obliquidens]|nr:platelet-derived growth factor C isoform X5 [Lagenorhynchus obliquidens]
MVLVWRLVAVEENVWIQLTFDERFGLEDPEDDICKYDFVEVEEPSDGAVLGRWCGSGTVPGKQISKGNQIRIRFVSDEYFPSEPGFCIHYNIVMPQLTETVSPSVLPAAALPLDLLNNAVTAFSTLEDLIRYLEPDRWQLDLEDLYRPTWQLLGKAFVFGRKSRVLGLNLLKEEVRLYSCTPRNFSVSIREELKRTDTVFWPGCLLVKRCGGNCACCLHTCSECQCVPSKVTKKYHEEESTCDRCHVLAQMVCCLCCHHQKSVLQRAPWTRTPAAFLNPVPAMGSSPAEPRQPTYTWVRNEQFLL